MEVDDSPGDATTPAAVKKGKGATDAITPLCNGDAKEKTNGVNGDESAPGTPGSNAVTGDEESSQDSADSRAASRDGTTINGDAENGEDSNDKEHVSGKGDNKRRSEDSVMEIEDDDDENSKETSAKAEGNSAENKKAVEKNCDKASDADESSQDSVLSKSKDGDKAATMKGDSDVEMIEDDSNDTKTPLAVKKSNETEKKPPETDKGDESDKKDEDGEKEKSPAAIEPESIETKAEAAARKKAEQAKLAKFAVMDKPEEILDMRPMAHLLHDIGMDLCRESVYTHLIKVQNKKQSQNKLGDAEVEQLDKLKEHQVAIKKKNDAFHMESMKCPTCPFRTESQNVLEWHLEFAHGQDEESYACSFCEFSTKMPGVFFFHMENEHKRKGRIYMRSAQYSCPMCPFENNKKPTMNKHRLRCEKSFRSNKNLEPAPTDCDIPLKKTKKQLAQAAAAAQRAATRNQAGAAPVTGGRVPPPLQPRPVGGAIANTAAARGSPNVAQAISQPVMSMSPVVRAGTPATSNSIALAAQAIAKQAAANVFNQQRLKAGGAGKATGGAIPLTGQQVPGGMIPMYPPGTTQSQILAGSVRPTHYAIGNQLYQIVNQGGQFMLQPVQQGSQFHIRQATKPGQGRQPSVPLQNALATAQKNVERRQAEEKRRQLGKDQKFEICEICGGFVKDRDSLHIHFFWAHKVEINKEVFQQQQPHLICDICKSRFWTFQGLHRHRQMSHGTGKAPMVQGRGQTQNTYSCYMCKEKVAYLATHLSEKHNLSIQEMFKAKKCYVCGLSFEQQKELERHLVKNHRELLTPQKYKPGDKGAPTPIAMYQTTGSGSAKKTKTFKPECSLCGITFTSVEKFSQHVNNYHIFKCYRCDEKFTTREVLNTHLSNVHRSDTDECQICKEKVKIRGPFVRHMKNLHLKKCTVNVVKLSEKIVREDNEKWEKRKVELDKQKAELAAKRAAASAALAAATATGAGAGEAGGDVICLDSDEDQPPPAKKPALEPKGEGEGTEIRSEVLEVDGEKIVIEKQDEDPDTSNNSEAGKGEGEEGSENGAGDHKEDNAAKEADADVTNAAKEADADVTKETTGKSEEVGSSDVEMIEDDEETAKEETEKKPANQELDLEEVMETEES